MEEAKSPEVQAELKVLSDQGLWSLSTKFTSNADLKKLAIFGLKMDSHVVEKHIKNEKGDISSAAHKVLQDWRKSKESDKVAGNELWEALGVAEMSGLRGNLLLGGPAVDLTENLNNALDLTENLNNAYVKACKEGSEEIFVPRMNFVGYSFGGKSSLANRLTGDEFSQDIKSTEGVAIHRLKSFLKLQEDVSSNWQETSRDAEGLFKFPPYNTKDMGPFMDMVCLYAASQKALFGDNILVATFPKLLSSLAITTQWDLSRKEPLSYSEASLDIGKSPLKENLLQLRLTLSTGNEIESSIWCHRDKMTKDLTPAITSIKEVLFRRMAALNIGPPEDVLVLCPHFRPADNSSCMVKGREIQNFRVKLCEEKCRQHRKTLPTDNYSWLFSMYLNYIHCVFLGTSILYYYCHRMLFR